MAMSFLKKLLFSNMKETISRFPFPILCTIVFTFFCLSEINEINISIKPEPWFYMLLLCGFFSYTVLKLFAENHNIDRKKYVYLTLGLTVFLGYFCWLPSFIGLSLLLVGILLLLLIAPYIFNDVGEHACCSFNTQLAGSIFFSALATIILCAGLSLALVSIHYLFDVKFSSELYLNIWLIGVTFFGPFHALSAVPKDFQPKEKGYPKGIVFIFSYILAPLIIGYFGILYAYIIKILIELNLPKGNIAYMVLAFGLIGIFTHIFSYSIRDTGTKLLKIVCRYFYYALLAPIALLFVGIGVRISDYGVTEPRYLVVIFAVWFLLSSTYFIIKKETKFKNIILTISTMLILSSFGIWGAEHVSGISQVTRLQNLLEKNNILINGAIHKTSGQIDFEDRKNISAIVEYLSKDHKAALIKNWFANYSYINSTTDKRLRASKITDDMGVIYLNKWQKSDTFNLSAPQVIGKNPILFNIQTFDYYTNVGYVDFGANDWPKTLEVHNEKDKTLELYTVKNGVLGVRYPYKDISVHFDLSSTVQSFINDGIKSGKIPESKRDLFTITKANKGLEIRIYLTNISGSIKDGAPVISYINVAIAVKYREKPEQF